MDGVALEDGGESGGNHVCNNYASEDVAADTEPLLHKDSEVEEENGYLGEIDGELVGDLKRVEELQSKCLAV